MQQKRMHRMFSPLLIIVFLSACSTPSLPSPTQPIATETQVPQATSTQVATEAPATTVSPTASTAGGLCTNTYYPVRDGSTWSYKSSGGPAGEYSFTDTITALRNDGFTLTSQFSKLTRTQDWACKPEGLVALQLGGAAVSTQNMNLTVETQNVSGITYPKDLQAGDQWDYALDFTGKMQVGGNSADAKGNDKNHFTATGVESVSVPAGTFNALKVQVDTTLDITATVQGVSVPVALSSTYTYWFVQDVGWVKASGTGSLAGTSFSETIELQSYNIP